MARYLKELGTIYPAAFFLAAAIAGLIGTNAQAQLSRRKLLESADPKIAELGSLWTPSRRLAPADARRRRPVLEAALKAEPERWREYEDLLRELRAWNLLETSVACAFLGALAAAIAVIV